MNQPKPLTFDDMLNIHLYEKDRGIDHNKMGSFLWEWPDGNTPAYY